MKGSAQIAWRIVVIILLSVLAYHVAFFTYFWLSALWILLIIVYLVWSILRIHRQGSKDLENFLTSVAQHDFNTVLPSRVARDYPQQAEAYRIINRIFQEISLSRESSQSFREVIVEQVGVALIGYRSDTGEITLINKVAKDLLQRPFLRNISALAQTEPELTGLFRKMSSGERALLSLVNEKGPLNLSIVSRELVLDGHPYKLFAIQNIRSELEARETDSWIKLINVLTHEIKNSAIPIATLAEAVAQAMTDPDQADQQRDPSSLSGPEWQELSQGLRTIMRRSRRLVDFVETYGKFTRLPKPDFQAVHVHLLFSSVGELMQPALEVKKIRFQLDVPEKLTVRADLVQLEQVLINLVKNAAEAANTREIQLQGYSSNHQVILTIRDDGAGIPKDTMEHIFIPFYTTKEQGTGIGLSISRQIILSHHGDLRVTSSPGKGTEFEIILPEKI